MISKVRWPWSRAPGAKEAEQIVLEGGTAIGIACDVADEAQVAAMGTAPTAVPRTKR